MGSDHEKCEGMEEAPPGSAREKKLTAEQEELKLKQSEVARAVMAKVRDRLKHLRLRHPAGRLNQDEFADSVLVSKRQIAGGESGQGANWTLVNLARVAAGAGVDISYFFCDHCYEETEAQMDVLARLKESGVTSVALRSTSTSSDRADEEQPRLGERAAGDWRFARSGRTEALGVDAVVDVRDPGRRHTQAIAQIRLDVARQRDEVVHERPIQATNEPVATGLQVEIPHVAAVLAVHAHRDAGSPGWDHRLERGEVARVNDRGPQLAEQAVQGRVEAERVPGRLVQGDARHVFPLDPRPEPRRIRQQGGIVETGLRRREERVDRSRVGDPACCQKFRDPIVQAVPSACSR